MRSESNISRSNSRKHKTLTLVNRSHSILAVILAFGLLIPFSVSAKAQEAELSAAAALPAQDKQTIAAVVNDQPISNYDVEQRVSLVVTSAGIQATTPQEVARLRAQVMRNLVEESLKLQEADRLELEISSGQVDAAIEDMVGQNNMTVEQITELLQSSGTNIFTLRRQVLSDLAWDAIIRGLFRSRASVTEEEVEAVYNRTIQSTDKPEYLVSEIYLRIDSPEQTEQVAGTAQGILEQLRSGASFPALAQQFSQASSAAKGGDMGWIQDGQLPQELNDTLASMAPGQISPPIRTVTAFRILALRESRIVGGPDPKQAQLLLRQIFVPLTNARNQNEVNSAGQFIMKAATSITSCENVGSFKRQVATANISEPSPIVVGQLPTSYQRAVISLQPGQVSRPILTKEGFHLMVICERQDEIVNAPDKAAIRARLLNQEINMMARRYLRDLRNDAIVDMR